MCNFFKEWLLVQLTMLIRLVFQFILPSIPSEPEYSNAYTVLCVSLFVADISGKYYYYYGKI